jgi:hypothetical protein
LCGLVLQAIGPGTALPTLLSSCASAVALISFFGLVSEAALFSLVLVSAAAVDGCLGMAANRGVGRARNGISHVSVSLDSDSSESGFFFGFGWAIPR